MIKCICGKGLSTPTYPHKDNINSVCFPTDEVVIVKTKCTCGRYMETTYSLTEVQTVEER